MEWNHSETIALAGTKCVLCHGSGLRTAAGKTNPCKCVLRGIFRACYARFKECVSQEVYISHVTYDHFDAGPGARRIWGLRDQEFAADFCLVAKRALDRFQHRIFTYHYLLGADWRLCCRRLNIDRGEFFHEVYRIQQKLGRTFRELEPYALFPLDEYFGGTILKMLPSDRERKNANVTVMPPRPVRRKNVVHPPLRKIA
jgi:hypothetical protein